MQLDFGEFIGQGGQAVVREARTADGTKVAAKALLVSDQRQFAQLCRVKISRIVGFTLLKFAR